MSNKIAVNFFCGPLGSGKTSIIRQLLAQKPAHEQWALLLNEFGAIGIDASIIEASEQITVQQLAGGCICCSAQSDFKTTLISLAKYQPDRLIIEPSGLGEPDSLADQLTRSELSQYFELQQIISVLDVSQTRLDDLKSLRVFQTLIHMADQVIINKTDLASFEQTEALHTYLSQVYPPIERITQHNQTQTLSILPLNQPHSSPGLVFYRPALSTLDTQPARKLELYTEWPIPVKRETYQAIGHLAVGWVFNSDAQFDWLQLQSLFNKLNYQAWLGVERAKGIFRTGNSWMLFQWVKGQLSREIISYRKDSRFELIINENEMFNFVQFEQALADCLSSKI